MKVLPSAVILLCTLKMFTTANPLASSDASEELYSEIEEKFAKKALVLRSLNRRSLPEQCGGQMVRWVGELCVNCVVINGFDNPSEGLRDVCCRLKLCTEEYVKSHICCSRFKVYELK
uniref:Uncharacterized protein n=1 Tax=Steinernema glaseri TaxID=37863 RepID=A0A1I7ZS80_9BILA